MTDHLAGLETAPRLYYEDLQEGRQYKTGGRTVTVADIVNFAGVSGDFHSLHMDAEFAASTPHGKRIAHGMLVVSMTAGLIARLPIMRGLELTTLGVTGIECRFLKPVFVDDTIHVVLDVLERSEGRKPDRGYVTMRRSVYNQRDELVVEGMWKMVVSRSE